MTVGRGSQAVDPRRLRRVVSGSLLPDLSPLYSGAVAFVYPSLFEGFGLPPLEAMKCGTPMISSSATSVPEAVGDAGIMVDPTDVEEMIVAVQEVVSNQPLRADLKARGLERASRFSWRNCAEQTASLYHRVARER